MIGLYGSFRPSPELFDLYHKPVKWDDITSQWKPLFNIYLEEIKASDACIT